MTFKSHAVRHAPGPLAMLISLATSLLGDRVVTTALHRSTAAGGGWIVRRVSATAAFVSWSLQRLRCCVRGHDMLWHFESNRVSLRCDACGMRTAGWTIDVNPAFRGVRNRPARVSCRVVNLSTARRSATSGQSPARAA
jgi:hypothetical protein